MKIKIIPKKLCLYRPKETQIARQLKIIQIPFEVTAPESSPLEPAAVSGDRLAGPGLPFDGIIGGSVGVDALAGILAGSLGLAAVPGPSASGAAPEGAVTGAAVTVGGELTGDESGEEAFVDGLAAGEPVAGGGLAGDFEGETDGVAAGGIDDTGEIFGGVTDGAFKGEVDGERAGALSASTIERQRNNKESITSLFITANLD